jgi:hypothetical protein
VVAALLPFAGIGRAQEAAPEYKFKAAYLYHFAQLVAWPPEAYASPAAPLCIAVLGQSPFGDELERTFHGKTINGHPLVVRTFSTVAEARTNSQVLFISSSEKSRLREIIAGLRGASVLTVGETDDFTEAGGMIRFLFVEKKLKFRINDDAAKAAGLTIPAKLRELSVP